MRISILVIFLLILFQGTFSCAQEGYNSCSNALEICPNENFQVNNIDANVTFCPNCEDDFTPCFTIENSIWLTFETNETGGDVSVNFSNLTFENNGNQAQALQATIVRAAAPCDGSTYTAIGNCENNQTGNFTLNAVGLPANTTYYILIDGDNSGGLDPAEATFDVSVSGLGVNRPIPTGSISIVQNPICLSSPTTILANLSNCEDTTEFNWFINGELIATTDTSFFSTSILQDGDIVSFETDCFESCPVTVSSNSGPLAVYTFLVDAGPNQSISAGTSVNLAGSTTASDFVWSPSFGMSDENSLSPIVFPSETTIYTLTATDANGCVMSDQVIITIPKSLEIPSGFSPNGDGDNDRWILKGIENYDNATVKIYTRWGQIIYQENAYTNAEAWDGNNRSGNEADEGVYFYTIELNDEEESIFKGNLTLLR